ncbi:MAG TPA: winged helix-turn-helix domain-containing protein, partial [Dongiaceae bacterium]|nr:winged helix-turn-helix domain-containing protein [Dongiaceae bacterium]
QYLRIYIRSLRQKIEAEPERPRHILTETGVGYRLRSADTDAAPGSAIEWPAG